MTTVVESSRTRYSFIHSFTNATDKNNLNNLRIEWDNNDRFLIWNSGFHLFRSVMVYCNVIQCNVLYCNLRIFCQGGQKYTDNNSPKGRLSPKLMPKPKPSWNKERITRWLYRVSDI